MNADKHRFPTLAVMEDSIMQRSMRIAIAAAITAAMLLGQGRTTEVQLKAAQHKEEVEGDLKGAIEQYKRIAQGGDRATAAKALIRMADCYQKLGDSESRKVYERVVREFADQKEAVTVARARLGGSHPTISAKGDRAVWTGPKVDMFGRVSPDGRLITYVDWMNGTLMAHDVTANTDRALSITSPDYSQYAEFSAISRDGKQVAYSWINGKRHELRVAALRGSGLLEPRQFFAGSDDIRGFGPLDWSPDGKWIALSISRNDGTGQIALVAVADGTLRVLKSVDWKGPSRIFFSPDSKYIAYDLPGADGNDQHDVFAMAIDGSREIPAVVHPAKDSVMGWSPDGAQLLFGSDRTGAVGLWVLPFADGKPQGAPELLRPDIGSSYSLGLTASGALYTYKSISSRDIKIAPIDLIAGKLTGPPASFVQGFLPRATVPDWSPDGKYLGYQACSGHCVAVRSVETGQVRQLTKLAYLFDPRWSPDGRSFLAAGRDSKGRDGIFVIDAQTGEVSPVLYTSGFGNTAWSHDGKSIYYYDRVKGTLLERNLVSGVERKIIRLAIVKRELNLSPDGRYLALHTQFDPSSKTSRLLLVPVDGGEPRELLRVTEPDTWGGPHSTAWTPDSRALIETRRIGPRGEVLLLPIDGTPSRKLDIDPDIWVQGAHGGIDRGFSLSPDGRHIAFLMGKSAAEVWALENFLPAMSAKR